MTLSTPYSNGTTGGGVKPASVPTLAVILTNEVLKVKASNEMVVAFDVTVLINEVPFMTHHGFELFRGFVDPPSMRKKTESGILWEKMVERADQLLSLIYRAIEASDWFERWPDMHPLRQFQERPARPDPSAKLVRARAGIAI